VKNTELFTPWGPSLRWDDDYPFISLSTRLVVTL